MDAPRHGQQPHGHGAFSDTGATFATPAAACAAVPGTFLHGRHDDDTCIHVWGHQPEPPTALRLHALLQPRRARAFPPCRFARARIIHLNGLRVRKTGLGRPESTNDPILAAYCFQSQRARAGGTSLKFENCYGVLRQQARLRLHRQRARRGILTVSTTARPSRPRRTGRSPAWVDYYSRWRPLATCSTARPTAGASPLVHGTGLVGSTAGHEQQSGVASAINNGAATDGNSLRAVRYRSPSVTVISPGPLEHVRRRACARWSSTGALTAGAPCMP